MDAEQRIGPYRLLEPLGRGGMGIVYRAAHDDGRMVALKTVRLAAENQLAGLRREVHALARLRHPGIVRILDEGVSQGLPWYAMELLEGVTLDRYARTLDSISIEAEPPSSGAATPTNTEMPGEEWWTQTLHSTSSAQVGQTAEKATPTPFGPPATASATRRAVWAGLHSAPNRSETTPHRGAAPPGFERSDAAAEPLSDRVVKLLGLVRRLCAPLAYLHGEGLVHRDLKCANVLVRPDGMPVLVDFGLAAQFGGDVSREALTAAGFTAGTVSGMAPEQIRGELVDARADIYALGCILYELLTGRPPFLGDVPVEVLWQHLHSNPGSLSKLAPDVPPRLEALVLQLLAKDPRQRLGHPDDVAAAIGRLGVADDAVLVAHLEALPRARACLYRPTLAGRQDALSLLEGHLDSIASGLGTVFLMGGESGIGKTRLLLELARRAEQRNVRVLSGECVQMDSTAGSGSAQPGGGALQPLSKALRAIADRCRERGPEETARLLGRRGKVLAMYEPALEGLPGLEQVPDPTVLAPPAARARLFADLSETLNTLAEDLPLLLLLDDLQWADELTLQFLGFLARSSSVRPEPGEGRWSQSSSTPSGATSRLIVIGSYRSEEIGASLRALLDLPRVQQLGLERLDEEAVAQMVCDMLALPERPETFARYLSQHSEGNPFFVAEYLRAAVREGLLWRDDSGQWQVAADLDYSANQDESSRIPLPQSIRALVARRLDRLGASARRLVDAAAVLGKGTDTTLLATVSGLDSTDLLEGTLELLSQQVLEDVGRGGLRFVHDKLREVAYAQLAEPHRIELHRAAALALEQLKANRRDEMLASLAHHWRCAGVPDKARDCYLPAAKRAASRYALVEAERLYRAHLALVTEPTLESAKARAALGHLLLRNQGRAADAIEQFQKALDDVLNLGDLALGTDYLGDLAKLHLEVGKSQEAFTLCELALSIARQLGSPWHQANVWSVHAFLLFEKGDLEQARELYEQALAAFRELGDRNKEALIGGNLAALYGVQGRHKESHALLERTLQVAREAVAPQVEANALANLAIFHMGEHRYEEAYWSFQQSLAISREIGDRRAEGIILSRLATLHKRRGEMDEAGAALSQSLSFLREIDNPANEGFGLFWMASIERYRGYFEEATAHMKEAEGILTGIGSTRELAQCLCEAGHLALATGQPAREQLDRAQGFAKALNAGPESDLALDISKLQRATEAFEAGRRQELFRGELLEDIPEGVRRWFVRTGQMSAEQAKLTGDASVDR